MQLYSTLNLMFCVNDVHNKIKDTDEVYGFLGIREPQNFGRFSNMSHFWTRGSKSSVQFRVWPLRTALEKLRTTAKYCALPSIRNGRPQKAISRHATL